MRADNILFLAKAPSIRRRLTALYRVAQRIDVAPVSIGGAGECTLAAMAAGI